MSHNKSSKGGSDVASLIMPAAVILVLYATWSVLLSAPGAEELVQVEQECEALRRVGTSNQDVAQLRKESEELSVKLASVNESLVDCQREALTLCGQEVARVDQLETLDSLGGVLQKSGLVITADRTSADRSRVKLASTLDSVTRNLLDEVQKSQQSDAKPMRYLPANLPRDISPAEYLASTNSGSQRIRAAEQQLREVEVVGGYHNMVTALENLNGRCGNSVVVGVACRRPEQMAKADGLRLWTLQLQVRPTPSGESPNGPAPQEIEPPSAADSMRLVADQPRGIAAP